MSHFFILKDKKIVPVKDVLTWAKWFEVWENRVVADEEVSGFRVSTVFLGLDHSFTPVGPPVLWETMGFGDGWRDLDMDRCAGSWEQAEEMHARMVAKVKDIVVARAEAEES